MLDPAPLQQAAAHRRPRRSQACHDVDSAAWQLRRHLRLLLQPASAGLLLHARAAAAAVSALHRAAAVVQKAPQRHAAHGVPAVALYRLAARSASPTHGSAIYCCYCLAACTSQGEALLLVVSGCVQYTNSPCLILAKVRASLINCCENKSQVLAG